MAAAAGALVAHASRSPSRLHILFSSAYVHPSGHLLNHFADVDYGNTCTVLVQRSVDDEPTPHDPDNRWARQDGDHPGNHISGLVQTVSATADGEDVVILSRLRNRSATIPKRCVYLVAGSGANVVVSMIDPSAVWRVGDAPQGPSADGPVAATISPNGDLCLLLHKTHNSVVLEIQHRVNPVRFASATTLDLTTHLSLGLSEPDVLQPQDAMTAQVKSSHEIFFSPAAATPSSSTSGRATAPARKRRM